ncbi:MAG: hypothetical protein HY348_07260 [Nitrospira defluvii]|nr:hypothetical protein [Nitrospira defluvii]
MGRFQLKPSYLLGIGSVLWLTVLCGCVTEAPTVAQPESDEMILVVGRAIAVITGDRGRQYGPEVRQMELMQRRTGQRYSVAVESSDKAFAFFLLAGEYDITRVQISEGPFLSMAQLASSFVVGREPIVFVGTWRFGVDSPRYGRMVLVSMVVEDDARQQAEHTIRTQYPALAGETLTTVIPFPAETETRLYEVLPYPRYPKYFQRHVW